MVKFRVSVRGKTYTVEITRAEGDSFNVKIRNKLLQVRVAETVNEEPVEARKTSKPLTSLTAMERVKRAITQTTRAVESHIPTFKSTDVIKTPLPGNLIEIKVSLGERVKKGDVVATIVSMKMQNNVLAPRNGVVKEIRASASSFVNKGEVLVVLE